MNLICRKSTYYPVTRLLVPEDKVSWTISWFEYLPQYYTADHLKNCSYADLDINDKKFKPFWNTKDGVINRKSYDNSQPIRYVIVNNYPLNPRGRTGLQGRGCLGRWGPNHAVDALVTRWKRTKDQSLVVTGTSGLPTLQFLAILRKDCKKWAIPGGFIDVNEETYTAMLRELFEEAIKTEKGSKLPSQEFFNCGKQIYKGYVDDPRNTDNAWIETTATNVHDESGENTQNLVLEARDDAADVKWIDISEDMEIYATHSDIIKSVNNMHLQAYEKDLK